MPNPITGDFEAVLQVSGSTVNRLTASMHQNAFSKPNLPSFPHSVRMRIGDDHPLEGVRGLVHAQVGVPVIELIHGATDRFRLQVGVRAWYRPDPGTEPMPAFIHGTLHAEYRVHDIDPSCPGWSKNAADFLWIRVVRDSVRFVGTTAEDKGTLDVYVADPATADADAAANVAKVTRQAARLLARRFEATPHPVSKRFRRGSLRSLNAPIGGSAVALPIGLSGEPWGDIHSIDNLLLNGFDLAVGVNIGYIWGLVDAAMGPIKTFSRTVPVSAAGISTVYRVGVHPPSIQWLPQGSHAIFKVVVNGWANTNSILANASFTIDQEVVLGFGGGLWLAPGSLSVKVQASGLGHGTVANTVKAQILAAVPPMVQAVCNNAQPSLDKLAEQTGQLADQLKTLDDQAAVWLDAAEFVADGIVIRGTIDVAPRKRIVAHHEVTAASDAHNALESWIPGGRIDRMEWSWSWSGSGESGSAAFSDRFLLRRPRGRLGRWGMVVNPSTPLPGLDGWGTVCLRITGACIDPVTGQFKTVTSTRKCTRFGPIISDYFGKGSRLFLRDVPELSQEAPFPQLSDIPLIAPPRANQAQGAVNTLVVYVDEQWEGIADTLATGLETCRRYDAGLGVLVLFKDGLLEADGGRLPAQMTRLGHKIGISLHVNEDVAGCWTRALELATGSGEPGWALISPEGIATWTHSGRIAPEELGRALDVHLRRCADLRPLPYSSGINAGSVIGATALHPGLADLSDLITQPCPPPPLGRLIASDTALVFVQKHSKASISHLRKLRARHDQEGERAIFIIAVFDETSQREAEALKEELGLDVVALGDPEGRITDRFRIGIWPTTIKMGRGGVVSDVQLGITSLRDEGPRNERIDETEDVAMP
jgi:hypothetical protein